MSLYTPSDVDAAYERWGANCGPCALAAILGREVEAVRSSMDANWETRRYTNLTHMVEALRRANVHPMRTRLVSGWPMAGLVFLQWKGWWTDPGKPIAVAYRHTHWIAVTGAMIYDVNADASWVARDLWEKAMPVLMREEVKGCTGEWFVRKGIEVSA